MLAPLIVFAYNRADHLKKTLTALSQNIGARESELFIFIDGPKNAGGIEKNKEVFKVAESFKSDCFASVTIKNNEKNQGLAKSVIKGVTEVIERYGKVIVTEDDAVSAPSYISFMNQALDFYENDDRIWSIGGYTVPMSLPSEYRSDVLLTQRSSSYAWATWKDRWKKIDWEMKEYKKFHWNFAARRKFNKWGNDRASMLDDQMRGRINSWAIRFDYAMFKNNMYNVLPTHSLIQNIGHDGSGTHSTVDCGEQDIFRVDLSLASKEFLMERQECNENIRKEFCKYFQCGRISLLKRYIQNL